jgi:hypothetical protein
VSVRNVPWILALLALATFLVVSGFKLWLLVGLWLLVLVAAWLTGRVVLVSRGPRIVVALILLPILFLLAFEGGWYLIPADVAWLVIEVINPAEGWRAAA